MTTPVRDPFLFDSDRLRALASEGVVRRGIAYFNEHRVLELGWDEGRLWAEVEGSVPRQPYVVDVALDEDHEPLVCCTCPFDLEPACKHVVAALLTYADRVAVTAVETAAERAILDRQRRARTEVVVEHVAGDPAFGTWTARTLTDGGAKLRPHRVHLRSTSERVNACSCPDFAGNHLGTCKHIEAVLHKLAKKKIKRSEPLMPFVHLALSSGVPSVTLRRPRVVAPELAALLARHFDESGALKNGMPDAWSAIERDLGERDDVHLGDDARAHAQRLAADLAHAHQRAAIHDAITRTGGHLPGVRARLYPYQTEGVAFLASAGRAVLADDMGLGKTLQAIAAASWLVDHEGVRRVLVVCPASLKTQWAREIRRFTGHDAVVIEGGASPRLAQYRSAPRFTIVNYELVVRDQVALATELAPDLLILDEAQRIKNWRTKTAASIKALATRHAFVLTGTPLENRLEDLYSVMQVVDARVLGPLWHFMLHFHVSDERGKVVAYRNLSELRQRLATVVLRRDKRLVRDQLPDRIVQTVPLPLSQRQSQLHAGALNAAGQLAQIMARRPLTPTEEKQLLAALQTARMACDAAGLIDGETVGSPKLDELSRILEATCVEAGAKVVVFSQWERMTQMAETVATALGLGVARLHGGVPSRARGALVDRFRDDPDVQVFISTDAGSTGLNLQNASVLVNLDMPWNPAVLEQRIGRVHRLGQKAAVHAYLLVAEGSYEERVAAMVRSKAALFASVVEPESDDDVVAVSKRTLEAAVEAIGEVVAVDETTDAALIEPVEAPAPLEVMPVATRTRDEDDHGPELRDTIAAAQRAFAGHIEEMLITANGLVVILDVVDADASARAALLGTALPVAALDRRTWQALTQMGTTGATRSVHAAPIVEAPQLARARRQLAAGEALADQGFGAQALALFAEAMCARIAHSMEREPPSETVALSVFLFSEAVPRGHVSSDLAHAIIIAATLARAPEVPAALVDDLRAQAHAFVVVD